MYISSSYATPTLRSASTFAKSGAAATESSATNSGPVDGFVASTAVQPQANAKLAAAAEAEAAVSAETPSVDIKTVQDQLTAGLPGVGVTFAHIDDFSKLNGRLATMGELKEMMAALYDESNIPYGYITDGCYARAHLMDESFRQHGINNGKMFCKGDLEAKNDLMTARWWYHVAPLVFVDMGDGKPVPKIIDPGFSREPMDPEGWVKAMNKGPNAEIDLVSAEQYYPRDDAGDDDFGRSLSPAVRTMQQYSQRLHGIKKAAGHNVGEFKTPKWDAAGAGGDFVVDGKTLTIFPEGVKTSREPEYRLNNGINGALLLEPVPEKAPVSAAWDSRPAGFDPYKAP